MAASINRSGILRICKSMTLPASTPKLSSLEWPGCHITFSTSTTNYRRRGAVEADPDPRKNTQYPYVPGDPLHEEAIRKVKTKKNAMHNLEKADRLDLSEQRKLKKIMQANVYQAPSGLRYEKLAEGDIRLGRTILAAKTGQSKTESNTILLEGERLIKDALLLGAEAKDLYFCDPEVLDSLPAELLINTNLYKILYRDMKTWSDTTTPAGLLGLFTKPQQGVAVAPVKNVLPITLIFDSLRDPGNAGTLIRTAAAVGCERIIATKGSVNVWQSKVLRSAMGGHFSIPIYTSLAWSDIPNYIEEGTQIFLANTRGAGTLTRAFDEQLRSEDLDEVIADVESLEPNDSSDSDSDEDAGMRRNRQELCKETEAENRAYTFHRAPLTVCDYSQIRFNSTKSDSNSGDAGRNPVSVALVVGGETEGLSALAKKFAYSHYGQYVTIPMTDNVNSLNTSIAGSIILYELRRKLLLLEKGRKSQ